MVESGRRRRGNEARDFNPQARWDAPENNRVDRKLSLAGRKTPSPLAARRASRHPLRRSRKMDEALLHTISESLSWPVRKTPPVARFPSTQKSNQFSFGK